MMVSNYEWQGKTVLVTGASGFKGAYLCETLLELGANVHGTVRSKTNPGSAYNILGLDTRIKSLALDVTDRQEVFDVINSVSPDVIFHLAAKALVPVAKRDPLQTFKVNLEGTLNRDLILEEIHKMVDYLKR